MPINSLEIPRPGINFHPCPINEYFCGIVNCCLLNYSGNRRSLIDLILIIKNLNVLIHAI